MIIFVDESGDNPLPPGILVSIVGAGASVANPFTLVGGELDATLAESTPYVATFYGTRGPIEPVSFTSTSDGSATTVAVPGYVSPSLSQIGYALAQIREYPQAWWSEAALKLGGVTYPIPYALAAVLAELDVQTQEVIAASRLQTSTGAEIPSWADDFLGLGALVEQPNETDDAYRSRVVQRLQALLTTLPCIQGIVASYLAAIDFTAATVTVFDKQSNPDLAAAVGIAPPEFCILFAYPTNTPAWVLGTSYLGTTTILGGSEYTVGNPLSAEFDALVRSIKAIGTKPVYVTSGVVS